MEQWKKIDGYWQRGNWKKEIGVTPDDPIADPVARRLAVLLEITRSVLDTFSWAPDLNRVLKPAREIREMYGDPITWLNEETHPPRWILRMGYLLGAAEAVEQEVSDLLDLVDADIETSQDKQEARELIHSLARRALATGVHLREVALVADQSTIRRGRKVLEGAKIGHQLVHGSVRETQMRHERYARAVEDLHREAPNLSRKEIVHKVAKDEHVSTRTIHRALRNAKNS